MRPPRLGTLFALAACLILVPATAFGIPIHVHHEKRIVKRGLGDKAIPVATVRWTEVVNVAPRDSDQDGVANRSDDCPQTAGSIGGCPPEPPAAPSSDYVAEAPAPTTVAPAPVASSGGCPSSMAAESGSAGYSAVNPSSGAYGCYQILPSTAAAHGCDLSTPGGQDSCAASICATEGSGAWAASGASPC